MSYRHATSAHAEALDTARTGLNSALHYAKTANCPSLVRKIRSALKSQEGAVRHMRHRLMHAAEKGGSAT